MENENQEQSEAPVQQGPAQEGASEETEREEPSSDDPKLGDNGAREDELPQWAQAERAHLRAEAASYRRRLRETQDALDKATTADELAQVKADFAAKEKALALQLKRAEATRGLPDELAVLVTGDTPETIAAQVNALRKFLTPPSGALAGGLSPLDGDDGDFDPEKLRARYPRRRL